jgi:hypothetical protein
MVKPWSNNGQTAAMAERANRRSSAGKLAKRGRSNWSIAGNKTGQTRGSNWSNTRKKKLVRGQRTSFWVSRMARWYIRPAW